MHWTHRATKVIINNKKEKRGIEANRPILKYKDNRPNKSK
jgi:hypothetical protein